MNADAKRADLHRYQEKISGNPLHRRESASKKDLPINQLVIVWRITGQCKLDCHFCAYARSIKRPRAEADPDQVMAFGALLQAYGRQYNRDILVSWIGGEPFNWPPLLSISRAYKRDHGLRVSVTTNGIALESSDIRQHIIDNYDQITISVDGIGPAHDSARGAPGLYSQLGVNIKALAKFKAARGYGPLIRVNTILMCHTVYHLEELCHALAEWGVQELTFNALGGRDRPEFFPDNCLLPEQTCWLRQELPALRQRFAPLGLEICGSPQYLDRLHNLAQNIPAPVADCAPGRQFLFIDEHSLVGPCSFTTPGYSIPLAEIKKPSDLHNLPLQFGARLQQQTLPPCLNCLSTEVFGKFTLNPQPQP